jgi:hypothetical protein
VITPAYSPTATERALPRMALDFTTGILDSRVTVTRALNTATRINSSGIVEGVNANLPRFDYDPATLAARGLLIEETRVNLFLQSSDTTQSDWIKALVSVSTTTTSPDGTSNAYKVSENSTATDAFYLRQNASSPAGSHTLSFFAKKAERDVIFASLDGASNTKWFDLTNGTTGGTGGGTSRIIAYPNGWYRCEYAFTTSSGTLNNFLFLSNTTSAITHTGSVGSGLFIWGAQLEAGAFATSYIPTTTTSLTRNADVVSMTGTNFSSWYNASEGTFVVQFDSATISATGAAVYYAFGASDGTAANFNGAYLFQTTGYAATTVSSSNQVNITVGAVTVNATQKIAYAYKANDFAAALNGATANLDTAGNLPTVDRLTIGALYSGSNIINGHVAKLAYYAPRLINNEVRAFSK